MALILVRNVAFVLSLQLNEITPYLDGGLVYGTSKGWADALRTFSNGSLAQDGLLAWHDEVRLLLMIPYSLIKRVLAYSLRSRSFYLCIYTCNVYERLN